MLLALALSLSLTAVAPPAPAEAVPDPLAGKSQKDICSDDSLLLLKYGWDDLRAGGFKKQCCVKDALGDDDRCSLDWPYNDVPPCSEIDLLRNRLFALYGYTFKEEKFQKHFMTQTWYRPRADFLPAWMPAVAQKNATALKAFVKSGGCIPEAAIAAQEEANGIASEETCKKAGITWSLDLQKASKGHVDGVQQSEIAEVVTAQCRSNVWSLTAAACFAKGKGAPCVPSLTEPQQKAMWSEIKAISEDAAAGH